MKCMIIELGGSDYNPDHVREMINAIAVAAIKPIAYIVNFEKVKMINSGVLCALMHLHKGLQAAGGTILIANPASSVRALLDNSQVSTIIQVFDSVSAARQTIAGA